MAHPLPFPPPGFDELPVEDKLEYIRSLQDRVAAHHGGGPAEPAKQSGEGKPGGENYDDLLKMLCDQ